MPYESRRENINALVNARWSAFRSGATTYRNEEEIVNAIAENLAADPILREDIGKNLLHVGDLDIYINKCSHIVRYVADICGLV